MDGCIPVYFFACWAILHAFLSSVDFSSSKLSFRNTIRVPNSFDLDQARHLTHRHNDNFIQKIVLMMMLHVCRINYRFNYSNVKQLFILYHLAHS